ncbi:hypothetical protein LWI29_019472 [Acer saccharum]|uniref:Uncharacterized protein n=1 Tax=Acer saccharum TaxID=4024 RepID=A0AA39VHV3_ACESA|nr:hypothetical protein LWI29_019472 [Acer saccharum]
MSGCPSLKKFLLGLAILKGIRVSDGSSFMDFMILCRNCLRPDKLELLGVFLWRVWFRWNGHVHQSTSIPDDDVVPWAVNFLEEYDGQPLTEYYNKLNSVFMELDYRRPNDMECTADSEKYMKPIAEDRVYMFLASLDHNLDQVSSRVLTTLPLPSLEEAYSLVCREVQRHVTMGIKDRSEASTLAVQKGNFWLTPPTGPHTRLCTHFTKCVGESLDAFDPVEAESSESERPTRLFEKCYTRWNKCVTLDSSTTLDDTTMPSDDSSAIDHMVQTPTEVHISSPIAPTSDDILDSNPTYLENTTGRRYPLCDRKEPDGLGFSKSSSNVVYPISDFISYYRSSKSHLAFALQLSSMSIPSHFQEALGDPKWKSAINEKRRTKKMQSIEIQPSMETTGLAEEFSVGEALTGDGVDE